jgi:hypothetical protein
MVSIEPNTNNYKYFANSHSFLSFTNETTTSDNYTLSNILFNSSNNYYTNSLIIKNNGNIGIGRNNPEYTLDVNDNVNFNYLIGEGSNITNLNGNNVNNGIINLNTLESLITPGIRGNNTSKIYINNIDNRTGRLIAVSNVEILIDCTAVSGLATSATLNTTNFANITSGTFNYTRLPFPLTKPISGDGSRLSNINATNITTGILNISRYPTSGVNANSYTQNNLILNIDSYGRIRSVTNVSINTLIGYVADASNIVSGTLDSSRLPTVTNESTYGLENQTLEVTVDEYGYGQVLYINTLDIKLPYTGVSGLSSSATIDTTSAANIITGILNNDRLSSNLEIAFLEGNANSINNINASNITLGTINITRFPSVINQGTYGNSTNTTSITVDNSGRIISITNITINNSGGNDNTNASNIFIGTLNSLRYPTSGVRNGVYGTSVNNTILTVDIYGRITSVTNVTYNAPNINYLNVIGLSSSATINTTNINNIENADITSLSTSRLPSIIRADLFNSNGLNLSALNAANIISISTNLLETVSTVTPGIYGDIDKLINMRVDRFGRITSITNVTATTSLIANITNATNIRAGIISSSILPTITSQSQYGSVNKSISFNVDTYGRITTASTVDFSAAHTNITGLSSTATIENYNIKVISDKSISAINIGNTTKNNDINIYSDATIFYSRTNTINLYTTTNTVTNTGSLFQMPLFTHSGRSTISNTISIPTNFDKISSNFLEIKLYIYPYDTINVALSSKNARGTIISTAENHNYYQYGSSTTNISNTTTNIVSYAKSSNECYINMNIPNPLSGITSNLYLIDSCYNHNIANSIVHGTSSGAFIPRTSDGILSTLIFNIERGSNVLYRWSAINYY